jgi:hypothetical protein
VVAEKTRIRDEQLAAEQAANAEAPPQEASQPAGESQAAA